MVSVLPTAIFVHVPKNAGSALSASLGGVDQYWPMHVPWRCLEGEGKPGFGFIRDPWHRMVSLYYFLLRSPDRHRQRVDRYALREMGFKRWLLEAETWQSNEPIDGQIWLRQNQEYLDVGSGNTYRGIERLSHSEWGLPPMQRRPSMWWLDGLPHDSIGRVETIHDDLAWFAKKLSFQYRPLQRLNVTRSKPRDWRSEHDSETVSFIAEHHKPDIDMGEYTWTG